MSGNDGSDYELYLESTGNLYSGLSWNRSSTTLNITSSGHGLSTNNKVLIRNFNEDYEYKNVTSIDANHFSVTVADSGDTTGTAGAYVPAFSSSVTHTSGDVTAIEISAPGAGDLQLNEVRIYANNQESNLTVTVPAGLSNGGGGYSDKQEVNPVVIVANGVDGSGTSTGLSPTTQYNLGTNINRINVAGVDNFSPIICKMKF